MIVGTGVDIVEVWRIKEALEKWGDRFLKRIFSERELDYANRKKFSHESLAARFACKESVLKAFGDTRLGIQFKDIEVLNDSKGKPEVVLHGEARNFVKRYKVNDIIVSMSHTSTYAISSVILWRDS